MKKKALKIPFALWRRLYSELRRRSKGRRESGAFLLGQSSKVSAFICYDDLDPSALDTGNRFVGRAIRAEFVEQVGKVSRHDRDRRSNDLRYDFANRWRNALPLVGA